MLKNAISIYLLNSIVLASVLLFEIQSLLCYNTLGL